MSAGARRRRAFLMLALAVVCGGVAASEVGDRMRDVERRVGSPVPIVVAARDLPADARLKRGDLALREMPERYVPPGALSSVAQPAAARTAVAVAAGTPVTEGLLGGGESRGGRRSGALTRGQRAVEVAVVGGAALGEAAGPGSRVDVLVSTEAREGPGRSFLALEDVELLALRAGGAGGESSGRSGEDGPSAAAATATATLRVTLRQAVYLTAAQNFAREVRLLSRPPGDSRRAGRTVVGAAGL